MFIYRILRKSRERKVVCVHLILDHIQKIFSILQVQIITLFQCDHLPNLTRIKHFQTKKKDKMDFSPRVLIAKISSQDYPGSH